MYALIAMMVFTLFVNIDISFAEDLTQTMINIVNDLNSMRSEDISQYHIYMSNIGTTYIYVYVPDVSEEYKLTGSYRFIKSGNYLHFRQSGTTTNILVKRYRYNADGEFVDYTNIFTLASTETIMYSNSDIINTDDSTIYYSADGELSVSYDNEPTQYEIDSFVNYINGKDNYHIYQVTYTAMGQSYRELFAIKLSSNWSIVQDNAFRYLSSNQTFFVLPFYGERQSLAGIIDEYEWYQTSDFQVSHYEPDTSEPTILTYIKSYYAGKEVLLLNESIVEDSKTYVIHIEYQFKNDGTISSENKPVFSVTGKSGEISNHVVTTSGSQVNGEFDLTVNMTKNENSWITVSTSAPVVLNKTINIKLGSGSTGESGSITPDSPDRTDYDDGVFGTISYGLDKLSYYITYPFHLVGSFLTDLLDTLNDQLVKFTGVSQALSIVFAGFPQEWIDLGTAFITISIIVGLIFLFIRR